MNSFEENLAKVGVDEIIKTAQLFGLDYFKLGENLQRLLQETYIAGVRQGSKIMKDAFDKSKKEFEERKDNPDEIEF